MLNKIENINSKDSRRFRSIPIIPLPREEVVSVVKRPSRSPTNF